MFLVLSTVPGERVLIKYFLCFTWPSGNDMARASKVPRFSLHPFSFFSFSFRIAFFLVIAFFFVSFPYIA